MSQGNLLFQMQNFDGPTPSITPVSVLRFPDATYNHLTYVGYVAGAVSLYCTTANTFGVGCVMFDTTGVSGGNGDAGPMVNTGTAASPSWVIIT